MTPVVSVIVPVRNGGAAVKRLAASLAAQDWPAAGGREILFVDNGSTDGACRDLPGEDLRVIDEPKPGAPAARNRGAREARGDILVFTDHDCTADRRWLRHLCAPFEDPAVSAVAGETIAAPADSWAARYLAFIRHNSAADGLARPVFPFAPTANLAVRRSLFESLGGFDESLPHTDDADFSLRVRNAAGPIRLAPRAIVLHEERSSAATLFRRYRQYGHGWAALLVKHPAELRWGVARAFRANAAVAGALFRIPAAFLRWRAAGAPEETYRFARFEFVRRFAHRLGFVEASIARGRFWW